MQAKKIIKIGKRLIGDDKPPYIIAEIGINHNGSLEIARQLIRQAALCGADAVKFQKRSLTDLYQKQYFQNPLLGQRSLQYLLPILEKIELSDDDYQQLKLFCKEYNIQLLCTPFDKESVDFLEKLEISAYKIGSPDMTNFDLLDYVIKTKKPIIISTGMSTIDEIEKTIIFLKDHKSEFIVLHCNSNYPAPFHCINLRVLQELRKKFNILVGYSGHEYGIAVSLAAVAMGACVVERHFTLDRTMIGPDHAASLEPEGLRRLVRDVRNIHEALGSNIRYMDRGEYMNGEVLRKSLVAATNIRKGEKITREKITVKSPGTGLSPQRINEIIGRIADRNIKNDEQFLEEDINIKQIIKKVSIRAHHQWGIIARPTDIRQLIKRFHPPIIEMHLTDKDLQKGVSIPNSYKDHSLVIHAPEYWNHELIDYASDEKRIRDLSHRVLGLVIKAATKIKPWFKKNDKIGVVVHPGGMIQYNTDGVYAGNNQYKYSYLKELYYKFNQENFEILLENMPPFPWYFGGQWRHTIFLDDQEIKNFCLDTKSRICLDISHAALYCNHKQKELKDYLINLLPFTSHLHVADAAGVDGEGLQIGQGTIDFDSLTHFFQSYKSSIIPEIWQGHKHQGEGFLTALKLLVKKIPNF